MQLSIVQSEPNEGFTNHKTEPAGMGYVVDPSQGIATKSLGEKR